jgi:hypothetical protein
MGGQTLTCAICRSGICSLDLFFTIGTSFGSLGSGGGESGSVMSSVAGIAETCSGSDPEANAVLMKQNQSCP